MTFEISSATADITPPAGLPMAGYATTAGPRLAERTDTPLQANVLILWDGGQPRAIVSLDVLGLPRPLHQELWWRLETLAGWQRDHVIVAATHTHSGPALPGTSLDPAIAYGITDPATAAAMESYADNLVDQVVHAVGVALDAPRTPVALEIQYTVQTWSANREGLSYVETTVPVLVACRGDGRPAAVVCSYGTHPVAAGVQTGWDGDWPAVARRVIEAALPDCAAIVLTGAAGDQDPTGTRSWAWSRTVGASLGSTVVAATAVPGRPLAGTVAAGYREALLPLDVTPTPANLAAVRACFAARAADPAQLAWYRRHAAAMVDLIDAGGPYTTSVPLPVQAWRIGDVDPLHLVAVGGEPVAGYAAWLRNRYGAAAVMVAGYAGEVPCYVPSNELLRPIRTSPSYAGGWDADYPGIAGGSMTVYPQLGHFRAGPAGVEDVLLAALVEVVG